MMNDALKRRVLMACGTAVLLAGLLLTWQSSRVLAAAASRLTRKTHELAELRKLELEVSRHMAAVRELDRLGAVRAEPLQGRLDQAFPGRKADDVSEWVHESIPGWTVRRQDIAISEADLAKVAALVAAAEARQPPWRLVKCEIRSSPHATGRGQVGLLMEAIEKQE